MIKAGIVIQEYIRVPSHSIVLSTVVFHASDEKDHYHDLIRASATLPVNETAKILQARFLKGAYTGG